MPDPLVRVKFLRKVVIPRGAAYNAGEQAALPQSLVEELLESNSIEVVTTKQVSEPPRTTMIDHPTVEKYPTPQRRRVKL